MFEIASIPLIFVMALFGLEDDALDTILTAITIIGTSGTIIYTFGRWIKWQLTQYFKSMLDVLEKKVDTSIGEVKTEVQEKIGHVEGKVGALSTKVDTSATEVKNLVTTKVNEVGLRMVKLEDVNTERFNAIKEGQTAVRDVVVETKGIAKEAVTKVEAVGERLTDHIVESGASEKRAQEFRESTGREEARQKRFREDTAEEEARAKKFREGEEENGTPLSDQYKSVVGGKLKKKKKPDAPAGKKTKYNNPV